MLLHHHRNMATIAAQQGGRDLELAQVATLFEAEDDAESPRDATDTARGMTAAAAAMHAAHNTVILGPMLGWPLPGVVRRVSPRAMV